MNLDEVIAELQALNKPVPIPMRLPTSHEVEEAEKRLGVRFHPDYRKYLLQASNVVFGSLEPSMIASGGGHTDLVEIATTAWSDYGLPRDLLPICYDNGDHYCLTPAGEVVFWPHDGTSIEKWPDLATWIKQVWIEEN